MSDPVNVICLKWGPKYGAEYVNRLHRQVGRQLSLPHRFTCFTDDSAGLKPEIETLPVPQIDLPERIANTTWKKLGLFSTGLGDLRGPALFLDLDLIITGSLDDFFAFEPDKICIIHNWIEPWKTIFRPRPEIGNSSVFRFPVNECGFVIEKYDSEKEHATANYWPPQTYLTECIRPHLCYWPEDWVRSFKRHCTRPFPLNYLLTPKEPAGTRIVAFHGRPNPDQAVAGYRGKRIHHFVKPTPWIEKYWYD